MLTPTLSEPEAESNRERRSACKPDRNLRRERRLCVARAGAGKQLARLHGVP
jgi:hypothetical protein